MKVEKFYLGFKQTSRDIFTADVFLWEDDELPTAKATGHDIVVGPFDSEADAKEHQR